ncbi:MAG TPA: hypothetical protein DEF00_01270 [Candidatus Taylorbacteria bacterium]|nr:MAG: hypothetical protein UY03_C0024G0006 [Parcubacteria group bacterium GW2011_GWA2_47_64]KKU97025.1 MAG: hypothetical protein UY29_C0003G0022 [Parcubacteria group bacterium GW2011_GWC2_48_17]HBV01008.1 hypothetical protein [Candidatus Taylorbacteria bacterium]
MGDFKKYGGNKQRGGNTFNRGPGGRPSFGGGKPDFRSGDRGERAGGPEGTRREMFKAVCAECGKPCEVPFRPSGDRPVYCKDCFQAMGGPAAQNRGDRDDRGGRGSRGPSPQNSQKRDFTPRPSYTLPQQGSGEDKRLDDLKIQLATAISKLDKLINILGNTAHSAPKAAQANTKTLHDTLASIATTASKKETAKAKTPKRKPAKKK